MPTTTRLGLTCLALTGALALSGCKMLKDYYTNEDAGAAASKHGHGGHGEHEGDSGGEHGHAAESHEGDGGEHAPASASVSASTSASAPAPPASTVVDGEVHCTNARHLAFSGRGGNFCALPCLNDQACPDGATCSQSAPMVEKGKLGAYRSYCVSKIVPSGADAATTVVAIDPNTVAVVDAGSVLEVTDAGLAVQGADGGLMNVNKTLRGLKFKKKTP